MALGIPLIPAANTNVTLHTVTALKLGVLSQILVCNEGGSSAVVRIALAATDSPTTAEYIAYNAQVDPGPPVGFPVADYLAAGSKIVIRSDTGAVSFRACGRERDPF